MKKLLIISTLSLISITCLSQSVLFKKEVRDTVLGTRGPNLRNFGHFYIGIGFILGEPDSSGSDILMGRSTNSVFGYRYKYRICNLYSIGYDVAFNSYTYTLKQEEGKLLPDTVLHKKQTFRVGNLGLSAYMRFNYGKRGNRIGNFIDLGGYGDWKCYASTFTKDKLANENIVKTTTSRLKYINPINYGALVRFGFNRYVIYGNYRLSDIFKTSDVYPFPELPRITAGLQIGIHK